MKNIFFYLLSFTLLIMTTNACTDKGETIPSDSSIITIEENSHPIIPQQGGSVTLSFTAPNDWSAMIVNNRADSWLNISPSSGNKGKAYITITATANETTDERNATIILKSGNSQTEIVVVQKQKDALTITSSKYEVPSKGGNINVEVKSNIDYVVEIKSDWIKQTDNKSTRTLVSNILNFTIGSNDTGEKREGEIIIKSGNLSETIKVYQEFKDFITLTQENFTLPEIGGIIDIEIKSTINYETKMLSDVSWIREVLSRSVSTHTHHYQIDPNESYDSREAQIVFYNVDNESIADTVSIYQLYKGAILIARDEYQYDLQGGILNLKIESNLDLEIHISDDWIERVTTRELTEYELTFNIKKNSTGRNREGTILVKDKNSDQQQTVIIKQSCEDLEREALITFYNATGGSNWVNNTNWCSDKPINEWFGIETTPEGKLYQLNLPNNNLCGNLPDIFDKLPHLQHIYASNNNLTGEIPQSLYNLDLNALILGDNKMEGQLPDKISNWTHLLSFDIRNNNFSGTIPATLGKLSQLVYCDLMLNQFSGELHPEIIEMEQRANNEENFKFYLDPQQEGYEFTTSTTREMIALGDNLYLHPKGLAVEYRQNANQAITYEEMKTLSKKIYEKFNDNFDFMVCLYNVGNMEEIAGSIAGQSFTISNNVKGINREIIDNTTQFGSSGRLKALLQLSDRRQIKGSFLHELMHTWGALDLGQSYIDLEGKVIEDNTHWGISSVDGMLGGFKLSTLERNVDGNPHKYKATCSQTNWSFGVANSSNTQFAPLELYLMGFISPDEVPNIYYYTGISGSSLENPSKNGIFYAEEEHIITIQDIISKFGTRVPDYTTSQKSFNILTIVITQKPVNDREWALIEDDITKMQNPGTSGYLYNNKNFYEATNGKGTLTFDRLEQHLKK